MSGIFNLIDRNVEKSLYDIVVVSYTSETPTNVSSTLFNKIFQQCKIYTMFSLEEIIGILEFETQINCLVLEVKLGFNDLISTITELVDSGLDIKDYSIGIVPIRGESVVCPNYYGLARDFSDFNSDSTNKGYKAVIVIFASQPDLLVHPTAQEVLKTILL
jgi:hypothetical protein